MINKTSPSSNPINNNQSKSSRPSSPVPDDLFHKTTGSRTPPASPIDPAKCQDLSSESLNFVNWLKDYKDQKTKHFNLMSFDRTMRQASPKERNQASIQHYTDILEMLQNLYSLQDSSCFYIPTPIKRELDELNTLSTDKQALLICRREDLGGGLQETELQLLKLFEEIAGYTQNIRNLENEKEKTRIQIPLGQESAAGSQIDLDLFVQNILGLPNLLKNHPTGTDESLIKALDEIISRLKNPDSALQLLKEIRQSDDILSDQEIHALKKTEDFLKQSIDGTCSEGCYRNNPQSPEKQKKLYEALSLTSELLNKSIPPSNAETWKSFLQNPKDKFPPASRPTPTQQVRYENYVAWEAYLQDPQNNPRPRPNPEYEEQQNRYEVLKMEMAEQAKPTQGNKFDDLTAFIQDPKSKPGPTTPLSEKEIEFCQARIREQFKPSASIEEGIRGLENILYVLMKLPGKDERLETALWTVFRENYYNVQSSSDTNMLLNNVVKDKDSANLLVKLEDYCKRADPPSSIKIFRSALIGKML